MRLEIPFGDGFETVEVDEKNIEQVIAPKPVEIKDELAVLGQSLCNPIDSPHLEDFIRDYRRILLVVNDATRPTPTRAVLKRLYPILKSKELSVLVATGSHRPPSENEYRSIFGDLRDALRDTIFVHNAKESRCFPLGKTRYGNEIRLNAMLESADAIIPIGSIEPHYFAGYTGGRKSFMPGLAEYDCIAANHKLALSSEAGTMRLEGNPVAQELDEVEEMLSGRFRIFSIMTVLDREHRTYAAAGGDLKGTFRKLIGKADEIYAAPFRNRADIVVTVACPPTDIDLYQSHKAMENAKVALKKGGIMILVSACRDGIGPRAFYDLLASGDSCAEILKKMSGEYRLGNHKAGKIAAMGLKGELWTVSRIEPGLIRAAHMRPFGNVSEALTEAVHAVGPDAKITFLMDGGHVVPKEQT